MASPSSTAAQPQPETSTLVLRCTVAITLALAGYWLLNYTVFPLCDPILIWTREVSACGGGLGLALLAFGAYWRPRLFNARRMVAALLVCTVAGVLCFLASFPSASAAANACGVTLLTVSTGLAMITAAIATSRLSLRDISLCSIVSYCLAYALRSLFSSLPMEMNCLLYLALPLVAFLLTFPAARPLLNQTYSDGSPAQIALASPSSVLPFDHHFFVTLLVFRFIYGFTMTFGEVARTPLLSVGALIPLIALLLWAVVRARAASPDGLFKLSILFCIAGFLLVGVDDGHRHLAGELLSCGTGFFEIFMFFMLAALANRNPVAALPLFAWGEAMASWGTVLGANFGRLVDSDTSLPASGSLIVALVVFAIIAYVIIPKRGIDFSETVRHLAPYAPVSSVEADRSASELIRESCRSLADAHNLTDREREVFEYLARGRNVRYIQEELVVSYNTVKTHVSHIYAKLGVHSHQELIDLVEERTPPDDR